MIKYLPILLIVVFLFALPTIDPDFGWFYRCGYSDCSKNTFSVFLPNYQWERPMIIYPVFIKLIFNAFAFWGLTLANILLGLGLFSIFHKTLKTSPLISIILFSLSVFFSRSGLDFGLRNQNLSLFFFLLTFYLLSKKTLLPLILLFPLWVNIHPNFPIGLVLIFIYLITHFSKKNLIIVSVCALSTLINPHGLKTYSDIILHLQLNLNTVVAEWVKPPLLYIFIILSLTITTVFSKKMKPFSLLTLIFISLYSVFALRNLPYFYFLYPIITFQNFKIKRLEKLESSKITFFLALGFALTIGLNTLPKTIDLNSNWKSYCNKGVTAFPCEASEVLKKLPPGNIFHTYEWGGFLIWQLPEFKTFVDGRMTAWFTRRSSGEGGPVSPYVIYLSTYQTQPGWQDTLKKYNIDYILISPGTFLDLELKKNKYPWKEIFKSKFSVLYKKYVR